MCCWRHHEWACEAVSSKDMKDHSFFQLVATRARCNLIGRLATLHPRVCVLTINYGGRELRETFVFDSPGIVQRQVSVYDGILNCLVCL